MVGEDGCYLCEPHRPEGALGGIINAARMGVQGDSTGTGHTLMRGMLHVVRRRYRFPAVRVTCSFFGGVAVGDVFAMCNAAVVAKMHGILAYWDTCDM